MTPAIKRSTLLHWTLGVYVSLMVAWTLTWMLKVNLDTQNAWLAGSEGGFVFWTAAKVLIWIVPALLLIKLSGRSLGEVFNLSNWKRWLAWGTGIGVLIALTGYASKYAAGQPFWPSELSLALLSVLTVAPIFEEFLLRGAIMGNLQQSIPFWPANILASLMFVGLHVPGWYFMGVLPDKLTAPIGGAASIFVLGLAFGLAVYKGKSVIGGMIAHFFNNLSAAG